MKLKTILFVSVAILSAVPSARGIVWSVIRAFLEGWPS